MSATDLAAVIVAVAALALVAGLVVMIVQLSIRSPVALSFSSQSPAKVIGPSGRVM